MFQVFCSHLGQLIQQLHTVLEKMELLAAPTVDINGVKSSLAEYQVRTDPQCPLTLQSDTGSRLKYGYISTTLAVRSYLKFTLSFKFGKKNISEL